MFKIYRKYNLFGRKYFTKDNTINGSIKNTIIINTVNCCGYKIIINNYVDLIFIFLLLFDVIRSMDNLKQIVFYFCILLFLKYICSVFIKLKIKFNNSTVGSIKHLFLSNTINILLNENKYEIYSHGGNYFSIMKNNIQIALINTDGKIVMNELCFACKYSNEDIKNIALFTMIIDTYFYKYKIGNKKNMIISKEFTYNFFDRHRERLFWTGKSICKNRHKLV